jgi:tetratricopeptide (TPR) repeat protein
MDWNIFRNDRAASKSKDVNFDNNEYEAQRCYELALHKFKLNDFFAAILDCDKAIEINPNYSEAYSLRGSAKYYVTFLNIRNKRKLIPDIMERIKSEHNIEELRKEYFDPLNDFNKAIEINPNDALTLRERAILKIETKDFEGSLNDLELVVKIDASYKERILLDLERLKIDWEYEIEYTKKLND